MFVCLIVTYCSRRLMRFRSRLCCWASRMTRKAFFLVQSSVILVFSLACDLWQSLFILESVFSWFSLTIIVLPFNRWLDPQPSSSQHPSTHTSFNLCFSSWPFPGSHVALTWCIALYNVAALQNCTTSVATRSTCQRMPLKRHPHHQYFCIPYSLSAFSQRRVKSLRPSEKPTSWGHSFHNQSHACSVRLAVRLTGFLQAHGSGCSVQHCTDATSAAPRSICLRLPKQSV